MRRSRWIASCLVAGLLLGSSAGAAPTITETVTPLTAPEGVSLFAVSPAGDRVAFVVIKQRKKSVVLDGVAGPAFDEIRTLGDRGTVLFSADGKHIAYVARSGQAWCVVVDNKPGATMEFIGEPRFANDNATVAFVAEHAGNPVLVTVADGAETEHPLQGLASGDERQLNDVVVSDDAKHTAAVVTTNGETDVTVDGTWVGKAFAAAQKPVFSADGMHCGFIATDAKPADAAKDQWIVVDGNKVGPSHDLTGLTFSADGKHWAAIRGGTGGGGPVMPAMPGSPAPDKAAVIHDGKPEGSFDAIEPPLVFSPDGARLAYAIDTGAGRAWTIDGVAQPTMQTVHTLAFSPDSKRFAYGAESASGVCVVVDGTPGPTVRDVLNEFAVRFSPDSKHVAYVAADAQGAKVVMLDGQPIGTPSNAWAPTLAFSPDSVHLVAQDAKHVTIDGVALQTPILAAYGVVFDAADRFHLIVTVAGKSRGRGASRDFERLDGTMK